MGLIIGIDVGGSTTKIVGLNNGSIQSPMFITATDPVTSLFGAFGKYIYDNGVDLSDIQQVMITGVGSAYIEGPLYGLPTMKADEFVSDGLGARYNTNLKDLMVVSMGTGTSYVKVEGDSIKHIGGISIGGGTLQGLALLLLKTRDFKKICELANHGNIANINLQIRDICKHDLEGLPLDATASLFGKIDNSNASEEDIALGLIYMVLQSIGSSAVLSTLNSNIKDFVLIGNLTKIPQCKDIFPFMERVYNVRFHIPPHAEFRTAIGAALAFGPQ
ncbi:MAG: type II pantothenate kinase [Bacteroidales bacterium]|nr:type II pantothenate kinase [Bacteroidales bacterium]